MISKFLKYSQIFNRLSNEMKVPVLAGANGKSFIYFTGNVGVEGTPKQKEYEKEMHEAARKATERINKKDEEQIDKRINAAEEETDKAFKQAKESTESTRSSDDSLKRQYQKWTDVDQSSEKEKFDTSQNREGRIKEVWQKLGEAWDSKSAKDKGK